MRKRPLGISSLEKPEEAPISTPRKIVVPKGARPIPVCQATIRKAIVDKNVAATDTKEKNQITQPERPMLATVNVASEEPKQVQPALPKRPRFEESHRRRTIYLENKLDYLIVDTGAGIADNVLYFNLAVQERVVVLTPEPTSLTDAYALIKVMKLEHGIERFQVLVNMAQDVAAARQTYKRLHEACDQFLSGVSLDLLGFVPRDHAVRDAIMAQKPLVAYSPASPAAKAIAAAASTIETWEVAAKLDGNIKFFWKNLLFRTG